jgi:teichuronic acid exporter
MILNTFFSLFIQFFLAKILLPNDFGVIALAMVFTLIIEVTSDLGMSAVLIQKKNENLTRDHFHTANITGFFWAILLYTLMFFLVAPFAANFMGQEILKSIIPILSLTIIFNSVTLIPRSKLIKDMRFKSIAFANNIANFLSGVISISLAYLDFGLWSLVAYTIMKPFFCIPFYFYYCKWRPKFCWSRSCFNDIFSFGITTTAVSATNVLTGKFDYFLIGKLLNTSLLGYYSFAILITNLFRDRLVAVLNKVLYPYYTTLQDDRDKMLNTFLKITTINITFIYPLMFGIILFSEHFLELFFEEKWNSSIILIKIFSFTVLIQMLNNSHTTLIRAAGEVRAELYLQLVKSLILFIPLISVGTHYFGIIGAATGYLIATFSGILLSFYFMKKIFNFRLKLLIDSIGNKVFSYSLIFLTTLFLKHYLFWPISLIIYSGLIILYFLYKEKKMINLIKKSISF